MKARILAVDDEPVILGAIKDVLSTDYDVTAAKDGTEALTILKEENFDLVLLDVMMPPPDGFEVCSIIKGEARLKDTPVIFITAKGQLDDIEAGMKLGATSYITKPFSPKLLLEKVQDALITKKAVITDGEVVVEKNA